MKTNEKELNIFTQRNEYVITILHEFLVFMTSIWLAKC